MLIFSILLFGEQLNAWQWGGSVLTLVAIFLLSVTGRSDGVHFTRSRGVFLLLLSILAGVASALYDKHILQGLHLTPLFVQSWTNLYITLLLLLWILLRRAFNPGAGKPFRWDWTLVLIAVLISCADALYFFAVSTEGAPLSLISMIRRSSVIVSFAAGAAFFHEKNVGKKTIAMAVMLVAMVLIYIGSR